MFYSTCHNSVTSELHKVCCYSSRLASLLNSTCPSVSLYRKAVARRGDVRKTDGIRSVICLAQVSRRDSNDLDQKNIMPHIGHSCPPRFALITHLISPTMRQNIHDRTAIPKRTVATGHDNLHDAADLFLLSGVR
jgi:hypothetical protein